MNARRVTGRIEQLEERFWIADGKRQTTLWIVRTVGWGLALGQDKCIQTLRECGFLPTGPYGLVNLYKVPEGLNAQETEAFLRANGAEMCSPAGGPAEEPGAGAGDGEE